MTVTINSIRTLLYTAARLLGWLNAALRGTLIQRFIRVLLLRRAGSFINKSIR